MLQLPPPLTLLLQVFAPVFSRRVWDSAKILLIGAILAPGRRTVAAVLRVMGLSAELHFQTYHRVLNRARWSSRTLSRILLHQLLQVFVPTTEPVILGIDETIERRRGAKITAKGIYRDSVRSSKSFFVKTSGLRWMSMHLLAPIPWAQRVWALPFFSVLAPSERYAETHGRRHKRLTDWARQMIHQVRRWLPDRRLVVVADRTYAAFDLLASCQRLAHPVTMITRLRLDARLFEPAPVRLPGTVGRPRQKGARLPTLAQRLQDAATRWETVTVPWYGRQSRCLEVSTDTAVWFLGGHPAVPMRWVLIRDPAQRFAPQALLCTDQTLAPAQILAWFVRRWQMEVTFHDVREHLGVETQRQWSDLAISRTTPVLLGLYSLVTLMAQALMAEQPFPFRRAAWYAKQLATFSDTLAVVRQHLWPAARFYLSPEQPDVVKIPRVLFQRMVDTLAYAA